MTVKCYKISAIDYNWERLETVGETAKKMLKNIEFPDGASISELSKLVSFLQDQEKAKLTAKAVGRDGDYREEPRVCWFPVEMKFTYGFAIKHDNNGDTFIVVSVDFS